MIISTFYGVAEPDLRPKITKALYDKKDSSYKRRYRHHIGRSIAQTGQQLRGNITTLTSENSIPETHISLH